MIAVKSFFFKVQAKPIYSGWGVHSGWRVNIHVPHRLVEPETRQAAVFGLKMRQMLFESQINQACQGPHAPVSANKLFDWVREKATDGRLNLSRDDELQLYDWFGIHYLDAQALLREYAEAVHVHRVISHFSDRLGDAHFHSQLEHDLTQLMDPANAREASRKKDLEASLDLFLSGSTSRGSVSIRHLTRPVEDAVDVLKARASIPRGIGNSADTTDKIFHLDLSNTASAKDASELAHLVEKFLYLKGYPVSPAS